MIRYLVVCLLIFAVELVDSTAEGGGLIVLPTCFVAGAPAHMTSGTSKLSSAMGAMVLIVRFAKHGYLKGKMFVATCFAAAALVRSSLGVHLALMVPETIIKRMMILIPPIVAFYALKNKDMGTGKRTGVISNKKVFVICVLVAFFVDGYGGFYGPGTGTFLILILTGAAGLDIRNVSAQTKVINLASNIAALATFTFAGNVFYPLGLTAGVCSITGHYIGAGMMVHDGQKVVHPVVLLVLAVLFVEILSGDQVKIADR